jgi:hypothetical protein
MKLDRLKYFGSALRHLPPSELITVKMYGQIGTLIGYILAVGAIIYSLLYNFSLLMVGIGIILLFSGYGTYVSINELKIQSEQIKKYEEVLKNDDS